MPNAAYTAWRAPDVERRSPRPQVVGSKPTAYASHLFFRGLPPPTSRPGRFAFHPSIVSGSQPRVRPIMASGSGSLRLSRPPLVMPRRSATCLTPRDMQPENTRHAVNLNDRRTRQTTNGTTQMLIHPLPTAHTSRQTLLRRTRQGPREGEGHHHPTGGMVPHTSGSAPDGKRPSTTGSRPSAPSATCPSPAAKHGTSDITTGATDTTDPNTRAATVKREQPTATACANTGTSKQETTWRLQAG